MDQTTIAALPAILSGQVAGMSVIIRADLEADSESDLRFVATKSLVDFLQAESAAVVKVIGHKGAVWQVPALGVTVNYNLRADPREEADSMELAAELAEGFDVYINEAFSVSHRKHTSVDALPRLMKSHGKAVYLGPRFIKELEMLSQVLTKPGKKVLVIGGAKVEDKKESAQKLQPKFDAVLKGGLLPGAELRDDGLDISDEAIADFKKQLADAGVIVTAGAMGKFEDDSAQKGTQEILQAIAASSAYKVAGGGETEQAITKYNLTAKFDWISVGGGAMLEFLASDTLPGIEAILA